LDPSYLQGDNQAVTPDPDERLRRLNELVGSTAQKETVHREVVGALNEELNQA